ncbi:hypothetical protein [Methanothrix sp.]|uniref:hypothetical protein n=1 Tax=Methanothrix sp. TaxID=90426 RepID=UPI003298135B
MPDSLRSPSDQGVTQAGGSYLKTTAFPAWICLFGPRPNFHICTARPGREWLEWTDEGRHHGLAAFRVDEGGLVDRDPIKAIPRKRPGHVSARQWGRC